jgi:NADPH2:quinone reductase
MVQVQIHEGTSSGDELPVHPPETMAAFRVHEFGLPPREDRLPIPDVGPGDVLVKLVASVVSHHDLTVAGGEFAVRPTLPYTPGLEGSGQVVRIGRAVDPGSFAIGAPVRVYGGGLGAIRSGTWAEYVVAPERAVTPVPEGLDFAVAAACGSVAATAWAAVIDLGGLLATERLGVTGASGAVGSLVLQLAAQQGVESRVGWVRSPGRADRLPSGVEAVANDDPAAPVDLLVDTVGGPLLAKRLDAVRPGGRAVLVGYTAGESVCFSLPNLMTADVSLLPLNMMRRRLPKEVASSLLAKFADGRLHVAVELIQRRDIAEAIGRLRSGTASGRMVFKW